ncbi:unnamed protein product [Effrenium voratum]|nr:unnamed protein product [Effrenium voratum]
MEPVLEWRQGGLAVCSKPAAMSPEKLLAWASTLGAGWELRSCCSSSGGLVLLADKAVPTPKVSGTYALLVVPQETKEDPFGFMKDALEFFGGPEEEARVVEEIMSGHFGALALVELDAAVGSGGKLPKEAVLAMQEAGLAVLRLPGRGKAEAKRQSSKPSEDVLPGTCVQLVSLQGAGVSRCQRPISAKWRSFLEAEQKLAAQRRRPEEASFCGLKLLVPSEQLRPRNASVALVQAAVELLKSGGRVLDLGCGCGALLLAIRQGTEGSVSGTGLDLDEEAVTCCRANAARLGLQVNTVLADFAQLDSPEVRPQLEAEGYDVIVCNPPYRSTAQQEAYDASVGSFGGYAEHSKTLVAGETGLEMYQAISSCLARDLMAAQKRLLAPPKPVLSLAGSLIFQVEAGSHGRRGGMAGKVAAAVQAASQGMLSFQRIIEDENKMERGILLKWSFT